MSLDDAQREVLRQKIMAEMEKTRADIAYLEELTRPIPPDDAIGRLTRMEAISAKSVNENSLGKARTRLARLEQALAKLDSPYFGICRECGEAIPAGRIMLMPESTMCVQCASELDN